jgi:hypothetical protein
VLALKPVAENEFVVTEFHIMLDDANGVTATCQEVAEPISFHETCNDVSVMFVVVICVTVLGQLVAQSKLKHVPVLTSSKIA